MKVCSLALAIVLFTSGLVRADGPNDALDPRPRSGVGGLVVGYGGLGFGVLNLATMPVCYADFYPRNASSVCAVSSAVLGAGGLIVGVTGLVIGTRRRAAYKAWRARQTEARLQLRDMSFQLDAERVGAGLRFSF